MQERRLHCFVCIPPPGLRRLAHALYYAVLPLSRLRFLITLGDVPLAAVTGASEAVMGTILDANPSAFTEPFVESRCPSDEAQWHMRDVRSTPPKTSSIKELRNNYKREQARMHKYHGVVARRTDPPLQRGKIV